MTLDIEFKKFPLSKICPCGKILNFDTDPEKVWIRASSYYLPSLNANDIF